MNESDYNKRSISVLLVFLLLFFPLFGSMTQEFNGVTEELSGLEVRQNSYYISTCEMGFYKEIQSQGECTPASEGHYVPDSRDHDSKKIASGGLHTCVILDDGSVSCWGDNRHGQLGDGTDNNRTTPVQITGLGENRAPVTIAAGNFHTCAALDDGSVSCWGRNIYGQLGDGTNEDRSTPTQVTGFGPNSPVIALSAGPRHTCAILEGGSVSCWGFNNAGQLGDGTTIDRVTPTSPLDLGNGRIASSLATGGYHTCVVLDDGSVSCWGRNIYGQLGDGTNEDRSTPTQTSTLGDGGGAVSISAGQGHTCALLDNGVVTCWGRNNHGQLGDGTDIERNEPASTSSLGPGRLAIEISIGRFHTCAVLDDGVVTCWGRNDDGQLGDGTNDGRNDPSPVSTPGTAIQVSMNYLSSCAILSDGSVSCWGSNVNGQIGDGTYTNRTTPVQISNFGIGRTVALNSTYLPGGGGTSQIECEVGVYQPATGQTTCIDASPGYYVDPSMGVAQTAQIPCLEGTYNANAGSTSPNDCIDADSGYFVDLPGQSYQVACSEGRYQAAKGQSSCHPADLGHYVDSSLGPAQSAQTACLEGTYNANSGSTTPSDCIDADLGHFVELSGQSSQTPCPPGTYQNRTGQTSCLDADTGHIAGSSGSRNQTACEPGTYQDQTGQSSCIEADPGYFVGPSGSTNQTACESGTYQDQTGQSVCIEADPGHFVGSSGSTNQTACGSGANQNQTGQTSCIYPADVNNADEDAKLEDDARFHIANYWWCCWTLLLLILLLIILLRDDDRREAMVLRFRVVSDPGGRGFDSDQMDEPQEAEQSLEAESPEEVESPNRPSEKEENINAELQRVRERAGTFDLTSLGVATASEKDDLQEIKGIGPFIEEKLNVLGIYTYEQLSKMTAEMEDEVNDAIELFPGRVNRDEWARQAYKILRD